MLVGTPPSFNNEQYSLENSLTTATTSLPIENLVDYECCVCRLTKSDSQSPMGLIGTSYLSLCRNK